MAGASLVRRINGTADGTHIGGDHFTGGAVPTRGGQCHPAGRIDDFYGHAIDFRLGRIGDRCIIGQTSFNPSVKFEQRLFPKGVIQAEHGRSMSVGFKFIQRGGAHALGRGVGGDQFGVCALHIEQLLHQAIVFDIRDHRIIQDIVVVVVPMQGFAQLAQFGFDIMRGGFRHISLAISHASSRAV